MGTTSYYDDAGNAKKGNTTSVNDTRTNVVDDIAKLKSIDYSSKFNTSVMVQTVDTIEKTEQTKAFEQPVYTGVLPALSDEPIVQIGETSGDLANLYVAASKCTESYNQKNAEVNALNKKVDSALASLENTRTFVNNERALAEAEISRLSSISKYKDVDDARELMNNKHDEYIEITRAFDELQNEIDDVSTKFETLLITNQMNYAKLGQMESERTTMEDRLTYLRETVGSTDKEYLELVDKYVELRDDIETLSVQHESNVKEMNKTELTLKNMLDSSDKMKITINNKKKELDNAVNAYENIDMNVVENNYNKILEKIQEQENRISNLSTIISAAETNVENARLEVASALTERDELYYQMTTAIQEYNDAKASADAIQAEQDRINEELKNQEAELAEAKTAAAIAKKQAAADRAAADKKVQEQQAAQKSLELVSSAVQRVSASLTNASTNNSKTSAKTIETAKKLVASTAKKVSTAVEKANTSSKSATSAENKVKTIENKIKDTKATLSNTTSTSLDSSRLTTSFNSTTVDAILTKINKNLNIPNPTETVYSSIEKYSKYYNRFKKPDLTTILRNGFPHVYFVRPSCNILDSNYKLLSTMTGNQDFSYAAKSAPWLLRQLVANNGQDHDFMLYLSSYASSFSLSDEYITTTAYGKNYVGDQIAIGQSNKESKTSGTFEIQFRDDKRLHIYQLHKLWVEYISNVYVGNLTPKNSDIKNKILDYTGAVYYIVTAEDNETIIFWSKYYGIFPTQIPSTQYSWGAGNNINDTNLSIQYQYSSKTDYNPRTIMEFNYNARCNGNTSYIPIFDSEMNGAGRSLVGPPFITLETDDVSGCPYVLKLRHRKPSGDM